MGKPRFNRGKWELARERLRIADDYPPAPDKGDVSVAGSISRIMKRLGLENDQWLAAIEEEWPEIAGSDVAKHTRPARFEKGHIEVFVDSAVWLSELTRYGKAKLLANLQRKYGPGKIKSVSFSPNPGQVDR